MKHNPKGQKTLNIGFVMDPVEKLFYAEDTSISIMEEAQKRGHRIYYFEPHQLFFRNQNLHAHVRLVNASLANGVQVLSEKMFDLKKLDVVFNRKDPPFDLSYLYLTQMLEFLEPEVFVINSPRGLRKANEKLYIFEFARWIPPTIVSKNPFEIERFQKEKSFDLILKPLDQKGGAGIYLLPQNSKYRTRILSQATSMGTKWIMAQKFLKENVTKGDKRILLLNGKPLGQFRRIPKRGEFRSNLSLGGRTARASLTPREHHLIRSLRPQLLRDGLYFVGLDVINGYLVEINVTSPAGIPEITELEGKHLESHVVDFLEAAALSR